MFCLCKNFDLINVPFEILYIMPSVIVGLLNLDEGYSDFVKATKLSDNLFQVNLEVYKYI